MNEKLYSHSYAMPSKSYHHQVALFEYLAYPDMNIFQQICNFNEKVFKNLHFALKVKIFIMCRTHGRHDGQT